MAERRMFTKKITESDAFLEMPTSTQALYFHLNMYADDDGFVNAPKKVQRMVGASDDDMKLLYAKSFVIGFDNGIIVIKHWKMHNYIRNDRYKETVYTEEKALLSTKENGSYTLGIPNGYQMDTDGIPNGYIGKDRLGKDRLGKDSIEIGKDSIGECSIGDSKEDKPPRKRFTPPTLDEVKDYICEQNYNVDADKWFSYYEANGWKVGRNTMKDWKASIRYWASQNKDLNTTGTAKKMTRAEEVFTWV